MSNKKKKVVGHYSRVSWHSRDYQLLNGFLLPELAYSALSELIRLGHFQNLDAAIREGLRILLEENAPALVRSDRKWLRLLGPADEACRKDATTAKADVAGEENLRFLAEMYKAMDKAEAEN
jgi:Arc/MetJ-type ribon-helix-helix transcriptional regulator